MTANTELNGWKLVPIEPTDEMIEAGRIARTNIAGGYGGPGAWEAMLNAAPPPPQPQTAGTPVANFEMKLTKIIDEYEQRREAILEDLEAKARFVLLRAFELALSTPPQPPSEVQG